MENESHRKRVDRRDSLKSRRSFIERRRSDKQYLHKNRRTGIGRRVLLSDRRKPIDRRDRAFFESFTSEAD